MSDSNATITRTELVRRAFRRIGQDNPTNTDKANAVALLNDILKGLDPQGRFLWTISNTPSTLTLVDGQSAYTVGSAATNIANYIIALERVEMMNGTQISYPLDILDKSEAISTWNRDSAASSQPVQVYLERAPLASNQKMHFYPTPNAADSIQYYYRRRLYDFDNPSDNPDFPAEHNQRLVQMLASELAPEYGVSVAEIIQYHEPKADKAMHDMLGDNTEPGNTGARRSVPTEYY